MSFEHDKFQDDKLHVFIKKKRLNGGEANVRVLVKP